MNQLIKNKYAKLTLIYFIFLFFAIYISNLFGLTMPDDGWRHLGMALYPKEVISWERVYPDTLYTNFDPWFMWHNLLAFISNFVPALKINIVVNSIVYSLLSLWYYLAFKKFTKIPTFFIFIFALCLPILNIRYYFLRPDILSGLFILYFLINKNKILLSIITLLYAPFYYVFWFFLGYLGYVNLILKEYKKTLILFIFSILGIIFFLSYDYNGYISITQNVLNNDILTEFFAVGESKPYLIPLNLKNSIGGGTLLFFLMIFSLIIFFIFKPKDILFKYIILFLPLFLIQHRFLDLLKPLIYIFQIHLIYLSWKIIEKNNLAYFINTIKIFVLERSYFGNLSKTGFKVLITILIAIYFIVQSKNNIKAYANIKKDLIQSSFLKDKEFKNKKFLITNMGISTYLSVFMNPTGEYIPGCSLGWVKYNKKDKKTYFDIINNNQHLNINNFFSFLKKNKVDYLIIDISKTSNLTFTKKQIEENNYYFYKIIKSKLIFRKHE